MSPSSREVAFMRLVWLSCFGLLLAVISLVHSQGQQPSKKEVSLFARDNLVAWCIVPFDAKKRGPAERAEMLARLGFKRFAYDWRAEHVATFDAEMRALKEKR